MHRDEDRLVIAEADVAQVNAKLVTAGLRVTEIGPERRSLEDLVLSVTGSGSDRFGRASAAVPGVTGSEPVTPDGNARPRDAEAEGSSQ